MENKKTAIAPASDSPMSDEESAEILGAARMRDSEALVRALCRLSAAHPGTWWPQLIRLATGRSAVDRLWIVSHVRIRDAGRTTFEVPNALHPDLLALAN